MAHKNEYKNRAGGFSHQVNIRVKK